jgi:hypothetical protein
MWIRLAFLALASIVLETNVDADPVSRPTTTAMPVQQTAADRGTPSALDPVTFSARNDGLDAWCQGVKSGPVIAVCGDDELRALASTRLRAFEAAGSRLTVDQLKVLVADQNGWALSYPQGCGLQSNSVPSLPLAPHVKECMVKAGQARLAYLQAYGGATATTGPSSSTSDPANPLPTTAQTPSTAQVPSTMPAPSIAKSAGPAPAPIASGSAPLTSQPPNSTAAPKEPEQAPPVSHAATLSKSPSPTPVADHSILQKAAAAGAILVALATVCLWILGVFRSGRERTEDGREPR